MYENIVYAIAMNALVEGARANVGSIAIFTNMSRLNQLQNINGLIRSIRSVLKNRCSLSEEDLVKLKDCLQQLQLLRSKKGKTDKEILNVTIPVLDVLVKLFLEQ